MDKHLKAVKSKVIRKILYGDFEILEVKKEENKELLNKLKMRVKNQKDLEKLITRLHKLGYKDHEINYKWDKDIVKEYMEDFYMNREDLYMNRELNTDIKVIIGHARFSYSSLLVNSSVEMIIGDLTIYNIDSKPRYDNLKCITGHVNEIPVNQHRIKLNTYCVDDFYKFLNDLESKVALNKSDDFKILLNRLKNLTNG